MIAGCAASNFATVARALVTPAAPEPAALPDDVLPPPPALADDELLQALTASSSVAARTAVAPSVTRRGMRRLRWITAELELGSAARDAGRDLIIEPSIYSVGGGGVPVRTE